jgi:PTH1 family peptidyl-tRNA hydrolase
MKIIIGLGNPGPIYSQTRHNAGAIFIEWLAKQKYNVKTIANSSRYTLFTVNENLGLCIPTTFMNESGKGLHALLRKYPTVQPNDIMVVHDDL